ncbi:MAG: hypothetical protein U0414_16055 [Polyangiaceae bacterium]
MNDLLLSKPDGFSLRAATEFYAGFTPGSGMAAAATDRLTLVFRLDRTFEPVGVELSEDARGIVARFAGTKNGHAVERQVGRMLGLTEGGGWLDVGLRDPRAGALQASFPGFFTAAKASPYDAAAWGVIVPRMNMSVAAKLKIRLAVEHGSVVHVGGRTHPVFPSPEELLRVQSFAGLSEEKLSRLHGVARAALEGVLDADRLRSRGDAGAIEDLLRLRGVGPWTAAHIYYRGAAPTDGLPLEEPRVLAGFADAFGREATPEAFEEAAEAWRPYRMWMCILLSRHLLRTGGWSRPSFSAHRGRQKGGATRRAAAQ